MSPSHPSDERRCKTCGTPLDSGTAGELCLRCALGHALETGANPDATTPLPAGAPGPSDSGSAAPVSEASLPRQFAEYELIEEVGRGGMGVVYRARQPSLDRIVAVKMLLFGPSATKESVQRFRTEATAAGSLQHPNIVSIHEVGIHHGQQYLVMDFVDGPPLSRLVERMPLAARRAAGYLKTIAESVHYAHEHGVLHRDLKPSNVLIDESDQPRITDFGLAKRLAGESELTVTGQVLGSPNYMPPEQAVARRVKVGRRSDVYALGATLYHLLTGRPPFVAETVTEALHLLLETEPVSPRLLNPSVPRDLETITLKCLEKEPDKRYGTAQALANELGRFLRGEPIAARPISPAGKAWRWCRRKPLVAALAAATLLAILGGLAGVTWKERQASRARDLAQRRLYAAQMSHAFRAWSVGNLNVARALLDAQRPRPGMEDVRGADWRWLWALCRSEAKAVLPTQGEWQLYAAEPSPDGQRFATAGWGKDIVIYNLAGQAEPQVLRGHTRQLMGFRSLAFSPDGRRLVSASGGLLLSGGLFELLLWDLATGSMTKLEERPASFLAVAFSPDSRRLASACMDGTVALWDADTHGSLAALQPHAGQAYGVLFSPDARSLFSSGEDGAVRQWDAASGREINEPLQHSRPVGKLAVAPDGEMLATECWDGHLYLWDIASRKARKLRFTPEEGNPASPAFSPDGRLLAFSTGNAIRIWDTEIDQETRVLRGSTGAITSLRFLPDGTHLVSACEFGHPMLWDIDSPQRATTFQGFTQGLRSMVVSSDSRWLAAGSGDFLDPQRPAEVLLFDLATLELFLPPIEHPQAINSLSLTGDPRLLATGCANRTVRIFTLPGGQLLRTLPHSLTNKRGNLVFSPDGQTLVTSDDDPRQITAWDVSTWEGGPLLLDPPGGPQNFAYSPDSSLLATPMGEARFTIVWNMPAGTTNTVIRSSASARGAAFSPDGKLLALHTFDDIEVFEVKSWKSLGTFAGHGHVINAIAFAPDGTTLASGSNDASLRLWSVPASGDVAVLYDHPDAIETVAFTPDGQWLISGARDKMVKLRRLPSLAEIAATERAEAAPQQ